MGGIEALRRRRDVIAALGHGQRDDADLGPRQRLQHRSDVEGLDEVDHRAGDAHRRCVGLLLDHRRQPVLRLELFAHVDVGLAHARADDRPFMVGPGVEKVVEIDRLMGAVKVADADMDDARLEIGPAVVGLAHARRQLREGGRREFDAHGFLSTGMTFRGAVSLS